MEKKTLLRRHNLAIWVSSCLLFTGTSVADDDILIFRKVEKNAAAQSGRIKSQSPQEAPRQPVLAQQTAEPVLTPSMPLRTMPALPEVKPMLHPAPGAIIASREDKAGDKLVREIFLRAVQAALTLSPELRGAHADSATARARVDEAKGQHLPQIDVGMNSRSYQFGDGHKSERDSTPSLALNMATTLYDFGMTSNTVRSRTAEVSASEYGINAAQEEIAWQVSSYLLELGKQRLIIEASERYVARMEKLVNMLSDIVLSDKGRGSELTQARDKLLQAQVSLDSATARVRETEIALHRLIGETQVALPVGNNWGLTPFALEPLFKQLDRHPLLMQARAQTDAALADVEVAKASQLPKLNWVVSKNTGKDEYGRRQAWETGLNVNWGIFRGGSARAAEQAAAYRAEASREKIVQQLRDLDNQVRSAHQDAHSLLQRASLYSDLMRESDRVRLDFFDQWYHLGKRSLLDVLSAEATYYNNNVGEISSRFDGYRAVFKGYASAGILMQWLRD